MIYDRLQMLAKKLSVVIQAILLVAVFLAGGFLLPMYLAPSVFERLPVTTPMEKQRQKISVSITNRNVNHAETFHLSASSPSGNARIKTISYSCDISGVKLYYQQPRERKQLPCDQSVRLPPVDFGHQLQVLTGREDVAYVPVTVTITNGKQAGQTSIVLATSESNVEQSSRLPDRSSATLQEIPG